MSLRHTLAPSGQRSGERVPIGPAEGRDRPGTDPLPVAAGEPAGPTDRGERRRTLVGFAVSGAAIAGVAWWASRQEAPRLPDSAGGLALLGIALVVYAAGMLARCHRWDAILRWAGVGHRRSDAYALTTVGYMGNTVLPARGGELLRILLLSDRSPASRREVFGTILCERILDLTALVFLLCLITSAGVSGSPAGATPAIVAAAALAAGALGLAGYLRLRARGRLETFASRVRPMTRASRLLITPLGAGLGALSVAAWCLDGLVFWLVAESLGLSIALSEAVFAVVLASFFSFIPAAPGFVGTYDAGVLLVLGAIGITGGSALSQALLFRFIMFVPITVVGLVLVVVRYGGLGALRRRSSAAGAR